MTPWPPCLCCNAPRTTPGRAALCWGYATGEVPGDDPADGETLEPRTAEALARVEVQRG